MKIPLFNPDLLCYPDLPDSESLKGLVFSLWVMLEAGGGFIGSSLGGLAADGLGFQWATGVEAGVLAASVAGVGIYWGVGGKGASRGAWDWGQK